MTWLCRYRMPRDSKIYAVDVTAPSREAARAKFLSRFTPELPQNPDFSYSIRPKPPSAPAPDQYPHDPPDPFSAACVRAISRHIHTAKTNWPDIALFIFLIAVCASFFPIAESLARAMTTNH